MRKGREEHEGREGKGREEEGEEAWREEERNKEKERNERKEGRKKKRQGCVCGGGGVAGLLYVILAKHLPVTPKKEVHHKLGCYSWPLFCFVLALSKESLQTEEELKIWYTVGQSSSAPISINSTN